LGLSDEPAESAKNGLHQLKIKREKILKILSVQFKRLHGIDGSHSMNGGVTIESRYRAEHLFFSYLTHSLPVAFDRNAAF
jgi:hypothetical protein